MADTGRGDPSALSPAERAVLERLDRLVRGDRAIVSIAPIADRVSRALARRPDEIEAWEPVPLGLYGEECGPDIGSSWVFILRRGVTTGAERHPNSRQRMMSWRGGGDFQVHDGAAWRSHEMVSDPEARLERRWISIPPETWHQGVVGAEDWIVVSFHTAAPEDLIEERPDPADPDPFRPQKTRRRKYLDVR